MKRKKAQPEGLLAVIADAVDEIDAGAGRQR